MSDCSFQSPSYRPERNWAFVWLRSKITICNAQHPFFSYNIIDEFATKITKSCFPAFKLHRTLLKTTHFPEVSGTSQVLHLSLHRSHSQKSSVFHRNTFGLQVFVERFLAQVLTETTLLESPKWGCDVRLVVRVDEHSTSLDFFGKPQCLGNVFGENARCQSKFGGVGSLKNTIKVSVAYGKCTRFIFMSSAKARALTHYWTDWRS